MNNTNSFLNSFVLYCFSDDNVSKVNTLSQFTCDCGSMMQLDGSWQVGLKDAYFGNVNDREDGDGNDDNDQEASPSSSPTQSESDVDSIIIPNSFNDQAVEIDFLSELLIQNSKNYKPYAAKTYFDKYSHDGMDYVKFPQYGFRDGYYAEDFIKTPSESDKSIKFIIKMIDFLTTEQVEHLKKYFSSDNMDLDTRQVVVKIPCGRELTLRQIVQIIIRVITAHHSPYVFSSDSTTRAFRDLERGNNLNAAGVDHIIHNFLNRFSEIISEKINAKVTAATAKKIPRNEPSSATLKEGDRQTKLAFIYSNVIEAQVVANNRSKLLALLPFSPRAAFHSVINITFSKLEKFSFKSISFEIRDYKGKLLDFQSSTHPTILVLQFRKII